MTTEQETRMCEDAREVMATQTLKLLKQVAEDRFPAGVPPRAVVFMVEGVLVAACAAVWRARTDGPMGRPERLVANLTMLLKGCFDRAMRAYPK
jgi:hypothetical protein